MHGTVFTGAWDEAQQRLDVQLERGLVSVTGPVTSGPIAVRTGQHLTVTLKQSQVLLRDHRRVVDELTPTATRTTASRPPSKRRAPVPSRRGAGSRAVAAKAARARARGAGRPRCPPATSTASSPRRSATSGARSASRGTDDLAALADAARYRRHDDVARRALLAQRRRFPGSPRAADAAFFLGRLDENGGRGPGRALRLVRSLSRRVAATARTPPRRWAAR